MANIVNQYGQVKVGVRVQSSPLMSTLMNSLYSAYNADSVGSSSLKTSLYAVYNGESNANDSFGANNGTPMGGLTYGTGKIGNAFSFNGTDAYVSLPDNSLNFTGDFSVSLWIYPTFVDGVNYRIITTNNYISGTYGNGWQIARLTDNSLNIMMVRDGSTAGIIRCVSSNSIIPSNAWTHLVITRKKSTSTKVYANGADVTASFYYSFGNATIDPVYVSPQYCQIGANKFNSNPATGFMSNGTKIDAVNFWQKELTQSEVTELYNSGNGAQYITDNFYKPTPNDALNTNNGTAIGGLTYTPGKIGTAFSFNGTNAIVEYPANSMNLTGDFTISFWTYMRSRDTNVIMSNYGNDGINRGFYIDSDGSYALRFVGNYLAPYYSLIKTDNSALFDMNVWMHFTFISKNGVGQWYKNGVANGASGNVMTNGYITNNKPIIGGFRSGNAGTIGSNKNMMLDAFTIWNKALTTTEITELYNSGNGKQYPFN